MTLEEALAKIKELETENTGLKTTNAELTTQVGEKDAKIEELNGHLAEKGRQFKALRDMTKEEKELLSEKELELLERQEKLEKDNADFRAQQDQFLKDQRSTVVKNLINRYARGDEELAKKIAFNLDKIKDSDKAMNEEALAPLIQDSFNMLGSEVRDAVRDAHNERGTGADYKPQENGFADSEKGKALSDALFGKEDAGNSDGGTQ
jgi:hypothetical protein